MANNKLYFGDNLEVMRRDVASELVDLVYLDPPFNSNRNYNVIFNRHQVTDDAAAAQIEAFGDTWQWSPVTETQYDDYVSGKLPNTVADALNSFRTLLGENDGMAYLVNMAPRLVELRRILKSTGMLYLHCDPTMSHYLKVLLDAIFGADHFVNEIIWQRTSAKGDAARRFGRIHDVLLGYAKSNDYFFSSQFVEKDEAYTDRFSLNDNDGRGAYRLAPLDSPNVRPNLTYDYKGYKPPAKGWRVSYNVMEVLDRDGRLAFPKTPDGRIARKHYLSEQAGRKLGDVWTDIPPLQASSAERLGYPTQKPLALMERLLAASTRPNDIVLDPFCGCGTTVDAAQKLGRRWIGIDITYLSIDLIEKRLQHTFGEEMTASYDVLGIPRDLSGAYALFSQSPFDFERWAVSLVNAQPNEKQVGDKGIDGVARFPTDGRGGVGRVLVSVKGGKTIGPQFVRDLLGTVETQKAQMGILVTMADPTRGIVDAVNHGGTYTFPVNGQEFPRLQIITVSQLLSKKRPLMPATFLPYIQAQRRPSELDTDPLFDV